LISYYNIFKDCTFPIKDVNSLLRSYIHSKDVANYRKLSIEILNAAIYRNITKVLIVTGFPISCESGVNVENDGPLGSLVLVKAMKAVSPNVSIDLFCMNRFAECFKCFFENSICLIHSKDHIIQRLVNYDFMFFIEYPGASSDGVFRNTRGNDISRLVTPLEDILENARDQGIITVSIGDRGNEIGMSQLLNFYPRLLPEDCFSNTCANYMLWAPVSNWAAYILSRAIVDMAGIKQCYIHSSYDEVKLLMRASRCGMVDGILMRKGMSVDGIPLHFNLSVVNKIFD